MITPFRDRPPRVPGLLCAVVTCLALAGTSCSTVSPDVTTQDPAASGTASGAATAEHTQADVGRIVGRLPGARRKAVRTEVTAVVDAWWEAAFLGGGYPRTDFADAFPGFTDGAARRARADRDLLSNADIGDRVESVRPLMRKLRLDLLAVHQRARSVTARFDLRLRTTGDRAGRLQVRGRLFLTRTPDGWRVFGYDVSKGWL